MRAAFVLQSSLVFLLSIAAWAQLPNAPQAPPAGAPSDAQSPAIASPAVTPAQPQAPTTESTPAERTATPAPALQASARVRRVAMMDINGRPGFRAAAFLNGFLVMAHAANDSVDVFDVRKRRLVTQIKDMQGASALAVDPKSEVVFAANPEGGNVAMISARNWKVLRTIPAKDSPGALLFAPEANALYAASYRQQTISRIDVGQGKEAGTVEAGGSPKRMAFDARRNLLFATLEAQNAVAVFDASLKPLRTLKLNASEPTGIVYDGKADRLYVAVRYAIVALDPESGREVGRIAAPSGVDTLVFDPQSSQLLAASEGGTVQVIRAAGNLAVEQEINTDVRGHTVAFDPETRMMFMPGGHEGRAKLLLLKQVTVEPAAGQVAAK